jgi:uncharacterized protein (TIGR02145 family)
MQHYSIVILPVIFFVLFSCGGGQEKKKNPRASVTPENEEVPVPADTSSQALTITDIDGNVYNTVKIGDRIWMKENLRTTRFNDGTPIKLVTDSTAWASMRTPAYCWYNNDPESYKDLYGALYNGFTASSSKICPQYWHVPGDAEWTALTQLLGGEKIAGGKLKESGYDYWVSPNVAASNETGFSGIPGGVRYSDGIFHDFGFGSYYWTSTESSAGRYWFRYMDYEYSDLFRFNNTGSIGFSIRCVRDY